LNLDPNYKLSTDAIAQQFEGPKYRDQLHTGLRVAGISG
jgi:hypothetical protein